MPGKVLAMSPNAPRIYVFYDYVCPYAYIGNLRADRLAREFDVEIEHLPWEIYPETAAGGEQSDFEPPESYTSWVEDLAAELGAGLTAPEQAINSNLALRGAEYAKDEGVFEAYHEAAFEAVWSHGRNLSDRDVLGEVVETAGLDVDAFFEDVTHHAYQARLDLIDDFATQLGVQRVPTFVFGDQRIVGNDRYEPSLKQPLEAFLERRKHIGEEWTTTLEFDTGLDAVL